MLKEPRPGRVKTRLARDIGATEAAWWYRHQVTRLLRKLNDSRWDIVLSVAPDRAVESPAWPIFLPRMPQGGGDLGARMTRALAAVDGPCVLIGSDIPGVTRQIIAKAFSELGSARSVVGPAEDGGFWLIGLSHSRFATAELFKDVTWSHNDTLAETIPTLPRPVAIVDTLRDVDTVADLQRTGD